MAKSKAPAAPAAAQNGNGGKDGDGKPINAVYGFCRMLVADLLDKPEVDHIAMILDAGSVTFRNQIYDKYKANRPDLPEDLIPQFPLIREAARAFNVTVCELDGFEA